MTEHAPLQHLPDHPDASDPEPFAGPDHPMRKVTRAVAFEGEWPPERATRVAALFDGLAQEWSADRVTPTKLSTIEDAIQRGGASLEGRWLEIGSGTGAGTTVAAGRVGSLVCTDISEEMLRHAPDTAPKVLSDSSALPFPNDSVDVVLLVNMLLFPAEVDRVLRHSGDVVWVNTHGDQTPVHLPSQDVLDALPGEWEGVTARAGTGFWLVAHRT
jgi:SAM-dependent methyltransferase